MRVRLDCPEHTEFGGMLGKLMYGFRRWKGKSVPKLLELINHSGCPHSGGYHKLTINGEQDELLAWMELFVEFFGETEESTATIKAIKSKKTGLVETRTLKNYSWKKAS